MCRQQQQQLNRKELALVAVGHLHVNLMEQFTTNKTTWNSSKVFLRQLNHTGSSIFCLSSCLPPKEPCAEYDFEMCLTFIFCSFSPIADLKKKVIHLNRSNLQSIRPSSLTLLCEKSQTVVCNILITCKTAELEPTRKSHC